MMQQESRGRAKREDRTFGACAEKKKITTFCNMHLPKDGSKYPSMELGSFSDML